MTTPVKVSIGVVGGALAGATVGHFIHKSMAWSTVIGAVAGAGLSFLIPSTPSASSIKLAHPTK